ncbi:IS4 family transposase [Paenibacillus sp. CAU 1782]
MGNVPDQTVICKCLNGLDVSDEHFFLFNYRRKFTFAKAVKLLIVAQLTQRNSLEDISHYLDADPLLQQEIGLSSISASQIGRTLNLLPLEALQTLWQQLISRQNQAFPKPGLADLGKLRLLDSTVLSLPEMAGKWAYSSKTSNGVKIHTNVVLASPGVHYADQIICSTRGVADMEVAVDLVVDADAIHVMDRGYIVYSQYKSWLDNRLRFVGRVQKNSRTVIQKEREVCGSSSILRDADVTVSYADKETKGKVDVLLRLVEYMDEKGRPYRILTNVWDRTAEQISEIYRQRWAIELFFKWMKQHLSLVHLYSYKSDAVWNQIHLAMIAYALVQLLHKACAPTRRMWSFLKLLRAYERSSWTAFWERLNRDPTKPSRGRQKKKKLGRPRKHPKVYATVKLIKK